MSRISPSRPDIVAFMELASQELETTLPAPKDIFSFGCGIAKLSDELLQNALSGVKTATTSYPAPSPRYWEVGDLSVILNGADEPRAIMRTTSLHECLFKDVPYDYAIAEGEGDYEDYRRGHVECYHRRDGNAEFGDHSKVLCEKFEIIYPVNTYLGRDHQSQIVTDGTKVAKEKIEVDQEVADVANSYMA